MPHLRRRHLEAPLKKSLAFSPIVGILGHRQVGKTTLAERLGETYVSLDRRESLDLALRAPEGLLGNAESRAPLVIDECQLAPPLFPALKEHVRVNKRPGQFLLTGSVRFTSRKAIQESLTGRIINWELLPMDLSESHSEPLPDKVPRLLKSKSLEVPLLPGRYFSGSAYAAALKQGGLPGIFAVRDPAIRKQRFETQIETLLERDLRLLIQTSLDFRSLRNLLVLLARRQGNPIELADLARSSRISVPALKRLLNALESMFVIRLVDTEGSRKKPVFFFEDQGEATHLAGTLGEPLPDLARFLFSFVRQQWTYRPELEARMFQYRTRGGAYVPLAIHAAEGTLGFLPMLDETPGRHELASAQSFIGSYKNAKCLLVHAGKDDRMVSKNLRVVPLSHLV